MFLGLGISSCFYYGNVETICNQPDVAVDKLPDTCTSFFANELAVKNDFNVYTPVYKSYDYGKLYVTIRTQWNIFSKNINCRLFLWSNLDLT